MLQAERLRMSFAPVAGKARETVLKDISFTVGDGEIVSITGKSGAGKSTIARIVCGLLRPDSGIVTYDGRILISSEQPFLKDYRTKIQLIPQQPMLALDHRQRIGDAVAEPMLFYGIAGSREAASARVKELLGLVWLKPDIADRYPMQISGGQAQRVVIARALGLSPKFLIADESTSMLDILAQAQIIRIFQQLAQTGISIMFISHDMPLVKAVSDKIYRLNNGSLELIA